MVDWPLSIWEGREGRRFVHHPTTQFSFLNASCYILHEHLPGTFPSSASILHGLGRVWPLNPSQELPRTQTWHSWTFTILREHPALLWTFLAGAAW